MFVKFELGTGYTGMDQEVVYRFPDDVPEDAIDEYGFELAIENADSYGCFDEEDYDESDVEYSWVKLEGYTEEQVNEEFEYFEEA